MPKKKSAPPAKRTSLRILKVRRTRKTIAIDYINGDESHSITSRDNPLPAFTRALDALPPLVCELLGLPETYTENMKAKGLTLTDGDNEQVTIVAEKSLADANAPFNIATPLRFLDLPKKEGTYSPALTAKQVELVSEVIEQAKSYVLGEREQGQIAFDDGEEGADDGSGKVEPQGDQTQPLPFPAGSAGTPARKKRSKRNDDSRAAAK